MKKISSFIFISILIIGICAGCNQKMSTKDELKVNISKFKEQNQKLSEENNKLRKELKNAKEEVSTTREGNLLRFELEQRLYRILRLIEKGDTEVLKTLVTDNIVVEKGKIINQNGYKRSFSVPKGNTYYVPRDTSTNNRNGIKTFEVAYEIYYDPKFIHEEHQQLLYVDFYYINKEWKLDSLEIEPN